VERRGRRGGGKEEGERGEEGGENDGRV